MATSSNLFGALMVCLVGCISAQYSVIGFWNTKSRNDLSSMCTESPYTKIIVGFINFKNGKPIPFRCNDSGNKYQCFDISKGISRCHELQKQVILGIGGPRSKSKFKSAKEAKGLARNIWTTYFAGQGDIKDRPFLGERFDGINFFMDGGRSKHFDIFLKEFNRLRTKSSLVGVIISISPSCATFERTDGDNWENPYFTDTLSNEELTEHIDEVVVRFNAKTCFNTQNQFQKILNKWLKKAMTLMFDIYYGLDVPVSFLQRNYITSYIKNPIISTNNPRLLGFAVLDVSRDVNYIESSQLVASENAQVTTPFTTPQTPVSTPIGPPQPPQTPPPPVQPSSPPNPGPNPPPPGPDPGPDPEPPTEVTTTTTVAPAPAQPQPNPPTSTSPSGGSPSGGSSGPGPVGPTGADSAGGGIPPSSVGIAQPFETAKDLSTIDEMDKEDERKDEEEQEEAEEGDEVIQSPFNEQQGEESEEEASEGKNEKKKENKDDYDRK